MGGREILSVLDLKPDRVCPRGKDRVYLTVRRMWRENGVRHLTPAQAGELKGIVKDDLSQHVGLRNRAVDTLSRL